MNTKQHINTLGSEEITVVESSPMWPFPNVVGGIPIRSSSLEQWKSSMQEKTQTIKRAFGDNANAQKIDYANAIKNVGEALL